MFYSILKQTVRKIFRNKIYSFINILGLTVGMTCCILAFIYVNDELSYDKQFKNSENIYRVLGNNFFINRPPDIQQPGRFLDEILNSIPEIQSGIRVSIRDVNIGYKLSNQIEKDVLFADSNFFSFFQWPLVQGNPKSVLVDAFSIAISERKAREYFGNESPIGKIIKADNRHELIITGVFKDFPEQSHIKPEIIISFYEMAKDNPECYVNWGCFNSNIYIKGFPKISHETLGKKLTELWNNKKDKNGGGSTGPDVYLIAQPFSDIYLNSGSLSVRSQFGSIYNVMAIAIISLFILIIVCFNFINLTSALVGRRNIESAVNKVLGAGKKVFASKVGTEIAVYILCGLFFSLFVLSALFPPINAFLHKNLSFSSVPSLTLVSFILGLCITILLVTSISPFLIMQRATITNRLSNSKTGASLFSTNGNFRKSLVVVQFAFGIILILSAIVINKQMHFIRHQNLGFDKDQLVIVTNPYEYPMASRYFNFKQNLEKYPQIKMVSAGKDVPCNLIDNWWNGIGMVSVDYNYFEVLGSKFIEGRGFNEGDADKDKIVINENFYRMLREEQPKGDLPEITFINKKYKVIGVVQDMKFGTIHYDDKPVLFYLQDTYDFSLNMIVKLAGGNISDGLAIIQDEWKKAAPNWPIEYYFMDEQFEKNYSKEKQTSTVVNTLTIIALFLCCLGLFGLALFSINGRIKEIGIRKVNGAKSVELIAMLNKEFVAWVFLSFVIACPITWFIMHKWLESFVYKTELSWWVFALAGFITLVITIVTVSWQSWRTAMRNPVEALRYE